MSFKKNLKKGKLGADLVIIGGGGSGLAAAVAAAEKGADVILLEKREETGGNAARAHGFIGAGNIAGERDSIAAREECLSAIASKHEYSGNDPRIIRAFVDKTEDTIHWLESKGIEIDSTRCFFLDRVPSWLMLKGGGQRLIEVLTEQCHELGVQLLPGTGGKHILTDNRGRLAGVLAETKEYETIIDAQSIILATGGYGGNRKLLKEYYPYYGHKMYLVGLPHTGDGLSMAVEMEAATEGLGMLHLSAPYFLGAKEVEATLGKPCTVWVNKKGERFVDEAVGADPFQAADAAIRQPDITCYALFDSEIKDIIAGQGLYSPIQPYQRVNKDELDKALGLESRKGRVKISDSWQEVAEWMGVGAEMLGLTVERYNAACARGYDPVFAKDRRHLLPLCHAPYVAVRFHVGYLQTIGGIKVNERMEIIDQRGNPIEGIYAAGADTGGWETDTYCAALSGTTLGFAMNSGRIAGENAAIYALEHG